MGRLSPHPATLDYSANRGVKPKRVLLALLRGSGE